MILAQFLDTARQSAVYRIEVGSPIIIDAPHYRFWNGREGYLVRRVCNTVECICELRIYLPGGETTVWLPEGCIVATTNMQWLHMNGKAECLAD